MEKHLIYKVTKRFHLNAKKYPSYDYAQEGLAIAHLIKRDNPHAIVDIVGTQSNARHFKNSVNIADVDFASYDCVHFIDLFLPKRLFAPFSDLPLEEYKFVKEASKTYTKQWVQDFRFISSAYQMVRDHSLKYPENANNSLDWGAFEEFTANEIAITCADAEAFKQKITEMKTVNTERGRLDVSHTLKIPKWTAVPEFFQYCPLSYTLNSYPECTEKEYDYVYYGGRASTFRRKRIEWLVQKAYEEKARIAIVGYAPWKGHLERPYWKHVKFIDRMPQNELGQILARSHKVFLTADEEWKASGCRILRYYESVNSNCEVLFDPEIEWGAPTPIEVERKDLLTMGQMFGGK